MRSALRRLGFVAAIAALAGPAAGCSPDASSPSPRAPSTSSPTVTQLAQVDGIPTGASASPDGDELLVSTQAGLVTRISLRGRSGDQGRAVPGRRQTLVVDLRAVTAADPQAGGLLNVALTPDGSRLLTVGNRTDGTITLASFPYHRGATLRADQGRVVLRFTHPYVHSGGGLAFDRDGNLLVSFGAFTTPGTPLGPQNPDGVVALVRAAALDGEEEQTLAAADLVANGLRNPWRITADPQTDRLWVADVGESQTEEIDVVDDPRPGRPINFGWPYLEGTEPYVEPAPADAELRGPALSYRHGDDRCAVVGGPVVRGGSVPRFVDRFLYGDYCSTVLRSTAADHPGRDRSRVEVDLGDHPVSLTSGPSDEVYVVGSSGSVLRLDPPSTEPSEVEAAPVEVSELPAKPDAGAAGCAIAAAVEALAGSESFTPERYRQRLTAVHDVLQAQGPSLPADLQPLASDLVVSYERAMQVAADAGWNPRSPAVIRSSRLVQAERGELAGITKAEFSIMDRSTRCR